VKKTILLALVFTLGLAAEQAKADFTISEPTNLGPMINSSGADAASISADGLSLFLTSNRSGGFGSDDIWVTTRATINDPWSEPVNLGPTVNSSDAEGFPSISADGLTLYFSSNNRPGGPLGSDLWMTTRATKSDFWQKPVNLGFPVNSASREFTQSISADGLSLYFGSERSGGSGSDDIWVTTRATIHDPWSEPVNLGPIVNSSSRECGPSISSDGSTLFFESDQSGGHSFYKDIWMTTRATKDGGWSEPVNLGPMVNTWEEELRPSISADGRTLYFVSYGRPGGYGHYDIWKAAINPIVDLNGDGIVNAADMCIIVDHWGTDDPSCDIGPMPWGDGIVDVEDLKVLAEYLFEDYRLIHHWMLDETGGGIAHDSVGDKDAVLYGDPLWQPLAGRIDGALALDGEDDYLRIPFILNPASGSFCVFAWIKGGAPGQMILSQRDVGGDQGNTWLLADASYGRLMTRLMHPPFSPLMSQSVITDNQWHHVGLMYDFIALHRYLYVDGIEVAKDDDFVGGVGSEGDLIMGADKTLNAASFFSGPIDDVRIYNNLLTEEEIAALAQ